MKQFKDSINPEDWLKIARWDWRRVKRNLRDNDAIAAGFFLQQCLEKYIKAFLISNHWELKKIHRLDTLLDDAVKHNTILRDFYDLCERVSGYYLADRYPICFDAGLSCAEVEHDLSEAERFIKVLFPDEQVDI